MPTWLGADLLAFVAWTLQRLLGKVALAHLGTRKFYLLSAAVSLLVYLPYMLLRPPSVAALGPAVGLASLMVVTFGVTTEAIRRGRLETVSLNTAQSPSPIDRWNHLPTAVVGRRNDRSNRARRS